MTVLTPPDTRVTPLQYKLSQTDVPCPPEDWYRRAVRVLRAGDGGEHGLLLYKLARSLDTAREHALLDVGTARGFSAMIMARSLLDGAFGGHVYTIDVLDHGQPINWHSATEGKQDEDEPLASVEISRSEIWSRWFAEEARLVTPVTATSHDTLNNWNHGPVSLAFLDGSHTYEAVSGELRLLDSLLAEDGHIVLDDYHIGIEAARVRSRPVNLAAWCMGRTLGRLWHLARQLSPRLGSGNEFVLVKQRYHGIRRAVAEFLEQHAGRWALEIVPMPSRGAYQGEDYALAILSRCLRAPTSAR